MKLQSVKSKTTFKGALSAVASGLVLAYASQASAFLVDNSNQKTIMIGKAGESMQSVQVNALPAPAPSTNVQVTQSYPQVSQNNYTTTVTPTYSDEVQYIDYDKQQQLANQQAYQKAQQQQYQQPTYTQQYPIQTTTPNYSQSAPQFQTSNPYDRLSVSTNSAAVFVFDPQTGQVLYEKNINSQRAIASVSKMMTAMVVLDSGDDMRETLTISSSDLVGAKSASTRLRAGDQLTRSEFMLLTLMKSENPAAKTLASHYHGGYAGFIAAMNQKAQSLGMYSTSFSDSSGLNPRNVSTASDLGKMMREIATNPRYQTIRNFSSAPSYDFYITNYNSGNRTYSASSTNRYVRSGSYDIKASKTGYIREAGYCVVMETNMNGRPAIVVQLGAGSSDARWNDASKILQQLAYRN